MLSPLVRRSRRKAEPRSKESGFTMALVALALTAIIAMAALSIDIGTLYQAKAEAQRAADAAALTAARMISLSGITGDPTTGSTDGSWAGTCGGANPLSTLAATKVAQQNLIAGVSVASASVNVTYGAGKAGGAVADCSGLGADFGVNPTVTVTVTSAKLPIFFARVFSLIPGVNYSGTTVSASATAEAFNPSGSGSPKASDMIPVQPRCVKPWIIPNIDNGNGNAPFVLTANGSINNPGVSQLGVGVIGESFWIGADCKNGAPDCKPPQVPLGDMTLNPPNWGASPTGTPPSLLYIPALVAGTPGAVPSCSAAAGYQAAIAGCDQTTVYACGTVGGATADLTINPGGSSGDTLTAAQCLTNTISSAGDFLNTGTKATPVFPFQIQAGADNPLVKAGLVNNNGVITTSSSIVSLPIADFSNSVALAGNKPSITIVGYLQVFINTIDTNGNFNVTVLNVAGCSNAAKNLPVYGTSPVPVRLITPP